MTEPIATPFVGMRTEVKEEWIDFNGHLNAGYYFVVFDTGLNDWMEFIGLGQSYRDRAKVTTFSIEGHITFERELALGEPIEIRTQLLGFDAKKIHTISFMHHRTDGWVAASNELLSMHISQETRRSAPMADEVLDRLAAIKEAHAALGQPPQVGRVIGLSAGRANG